jgi:Ca-activated chloride channel homolog
MKWRVLTMVMQLFRNITSVFDHIVFANPEFFYLFIILGLLIVWYVFQYAKLSPSIRVSNTAGMKMIGKTWRIYLMHLPFVLRMIIFSLLIIVLARPQSTNKWTSEYSEGIDIVITLDISTSMLAEDFKPNRLEAAKDVAIEFISARPNDRIGLVIFAGESFTQCPVTTDHAVLINLFKSIKTGLLEDGTAIGEGLATAVSRLKESKAKSKVIILLTDGVNNRGAVSPLTAAEIARAFGVRVYTVGVGTMGTAPHPYQTPFGIQYAQLPVEINEDMLRDIANMTNGKYFRATNNSRLKDIYQEIDQLEKTKIDVRRHERRKEEFMNWALAAFLIIIAEYLIRYFVLRANP